MYRPAEQGVSRPGILAALGLAAVLVATVLPGSARTAAEACVPEYVAGFGHGCRRADGMLEATLPDGYKVVSHGPDVFPPIHGDSELLSAPRRSPSCVSDPANQYHVQVVYGTPLDAPDKFAQRSLWLRDKIERMNGLLEREGKEFGRPMRYRMPCVKGKVSIKQVKMNLTEGRLTGSGAFAAFDFLVLQTELRRQGFTNPFAKYWLFFDVPPPFPGLGGVATAHNDDRPAANNVANFGPAYGVFYDTGNDAFTTLAMMHEGAHLHGAVQDSAPNASGNGHCIDDSDAMCYPDGGANAGNFKFTVCTDRMHFDCNHNDYFNPTPRKNSYLDTHWNLASPLNRFFAGCLYKTGVMTVGTAGVDVDGPAGQNVPGWQKVSSSTFSVPKTCRGRDFALSGVFSAQPRQADQAVGLTPPVLPTTTFVGIGDQDAIIAKIHEPDFNVCFFKGSKQLKCSSEIGPDLGAVPKTATKATVSFNAGARAVWVFSAI